MNNSAASRNQQQEDSPLLLDGEQNSNISAGPTRRMTFLNDRKVPNTGSTARDYLALERTYLAWLRTALSLSGAGLGFLKFEIFSVGVSFLLLGLVTLYYGVERYFHVMQMLENDQFVVSKKAATIVSLLSFAAILGATGAILFSSKH
eukprot:Nk52_evm77s230 gene=Nk52_evmTU77s230